MSTLDIQKLSQQVLDQVAQTEAVKTASEELPEDLKTEIGKALKEAASKVRECNSTEVTQADISSLFKEAKQEKKTAEQTTPGHPSPLGDEIRKLAQTVRDQSVEDSTIRTKQAAHIFNAAVGLAHLRNLS